MMWVGAESEDGKDNFFQLLFFFVFFTDAQDEGEKAPKNKQVEKNTRNIDFPAFFTIHLNSRIIIKIKCSLSEGETMTTKDNRIMGGGCDDGRKAHDGN